MGIYGHFIPLCARDESLSFTPCQLLAKVAVGHDGMAQKHARAGIAHEAPDGLAHLRLIAMDAAILAIALALVGAVLGTLNGVIDHRRALFAQLAPLNARLARMMCLAIDGAHGLERRGLLAQ